MNLYARWLLALVLAAPMLAYGGYLASQGTYGLVTAAGAVVLVAAVYIWIRFRLRRSGELATLSDDAKKPDAPSLRSLLVATAPFVILGYAIIALDIFGGGRAPGLLVLGVFVLLAPFMRRGLRRLPPAYRSATPFTFSKRTRRRSLWLGLGLVVLALLWPILAEIAVGRTGSPGLLFFPMFIFLISGILILSFQLFGWFARDLLGPQQD